MILHRLILRHFQSRDDALFYRMQAQDAIRWLERSGVAVGRGARALDLGCGHGIFGEALMAKGARVTFADAADFRVGAAAGGEFLRIDLDREAPGCLGQFDLVVCSNVLEHLAKPREFLKQSAALAAPGGRFYLSWTNWLSPWGGHEFSPFHYLGPRLGPRVYDRLTGRQRKHTPGRDLFPTHIGAVLSWIRQIPEWRMVRASPRYYPELSWIVRLPAVREFLTWNCALLLERRE